MKDEFIKGFAKRVACIDDTNTVLKIMNTINDMKAIGFLSEKEYGVVMGMAEKTRNYLFQIYGEGRYDEITEV